MNDIVQLEVLRELTPEDLLLPAVPAPKPRLEQIRDMHRMKARLVAEGKTNTQIAMVLGCSASTVATLREDPTFQELVVYFRDQLDVVYLENQEKAAVLARLAMDLMQEKLIIEGTKTPLRELKEIATEMGDRSNMPRKMGNSSGMTVPVITLNFGALPEQKTIEHEG